MVADDTYNAVEDEESGKCFTMLVEIACILLWFMNSYIDFAFLITLFLLLLYIDFLLVQKVSSQTDWAHKGKINACY